MSAILEAPELVYPESDGKPMAETEIHLLAMVQLFQALKDFFRERPDVYIVADMLWYWKEGRTKGIAPDIMVVPGVGNHRRRSFFSWRENGAVPAVVFEMASAGTWREDLTRKRRLYQRRGVKEYFVFDPEGLYLLPRLLGFRLKGHRYEPLFATDNQLSSDLGFDMRPEGEMLRLIDRATGLPIPTAEETLERAKLAEAKSAQLTAEVERLKQQLDTQAGGAPS